MENPTDTKPSGFLGINWDNVIGKALDVTGTVLGREADRRVENSTYRRDPYPAVQAVDQAKMQNRLIGIGVAALAVVLVLVIALRRK